MNIQREDTEQENTIMKNAIDIGEAILKTVKERDAAIKALKEIKDQKLSDHACMGDMALRMREIADEAYREIMGDEK
jgi:hypothetical protein